MSDWRRKLAIAGIFVAIGVSVLGWWGMVGKQVRAVDVLAIFAGGFMAGAAFVKFLQSPRVTPPPPTPSPPPPPTVTPPSSTQKSGG